jgi:hypothetical protein
LNGLPAALEPWSSGSPLTYNEHRVWHENRSFSKLLSALRMRGDASAAYIVDFSTDATDLIDGLFNVGLDALEQGDSGCAVGALGLALRVVLLSYGSEAKGLNTIWSYLATALYRDGDLETAMKLQSALVERAVKSASSSADSIRVQAMYAQMLLDAGGAEEALQIQRKLVSQAALSLGSNARLTLALRNDLAATLLRLSQHQNALSEAQQVVRVLESFRAVEAEDKGQLISARCNVAVAAYEQGDYESALKIEVENLELARKWFGPSNDLVLKAGNNLSFTLRRLGRLADARQVLADAVAASRCLRGLSHPQTAMLVAHELSLLKEQQRPREGLCYAADIFSSLGALSSYGNLAIRLAALCCWCIAEVYADPDSPEDDRQRCLDLHGSLADASAILCESAEVLALDTMEVSLDNLISFHRTWTKFSLMVNPLALFSSTAAMHGLESWATALHLLEQPGTSEHESARSAFLQTRTALQEVRALLAAPYPASTLAAALSLEPRADLQAREREAVQAYRQSRSRLKEADPTFRALSFDFALSQLQEAHSLLSPGDVCVLTVTPLVHRTVALITMWTGDWMLAALPEFETLPPLCNNYVDQAGVGFRGDMLGARGVGVAKPPPQLSLVSERVYSIFWAPVLNSLLEAGIQKSVQRLLVISAPTHHGISLEAGNPGIRTTYYCGLPAFLRLHTMAPRREVVSGSAIVFDQALNSPIPIPFTRVEGSLAELVLGCTGSVQLVGPAGVSKLRPCRHLLLSCHGGVSGSGVGRYGCLVVDAERNLKLDLGCAIAIGALADEVIVSACVAGVVGSTRWGDAIGLVPLWQLRGVRAVIACKAPVPDFYMPVLVMLYLHNRVCELPSDLALFESKRVFASGDWPKEIVGPLLDAYRAEMERMLQSCCRTNGSAASIRPVLAWPLPAKLSNALLEANRDGSSNGASEEMLLTWSTSQGRADLINACLAALVDKRKDRTRSKDPVQKLIADSIMHINAFTVCHGSA